MYIIYIHTHTHTHTHTRIYIHTCIHAYIHTFMHAYIHTYIHTSLTYRQFWPSTATPTGVFSGWPFLKKTIPSVVTQN